MGPHLSIRQYRNLDLFFFAVMLLISEGLILLAADRWFPDQLYTVSVVAAITSIVMIRWKAFAAVHAALGGLIVCLLSEGATIHQFLIYCIGNLLALGALLFVRAVGEKKVRQNAFWTIAYGVFTLFLMQTGRALTAVLLGYGFRSFITFYATDSLSYVFTAVILWIAGRQDGILEDQREYLIRIQEKTEKEEA